MIVNSRVINYMTIPELEYCRKQYTIKRPSIEEIAQFVAEKTGIPIGLMQTKTRLRSIVVARQIVFYIATVLVRPEPYTTVPTGRFFGLDHATVLHGRRQIMDLMESDDKFRYKVMLIIEELKP